MLSFKTSGVNQRQMVIVKTQQALLVHRHYIKQHKYLHLQQQIPAHPQVKRFFTQMSFAMEQTSLKHKIPFTKQLSNEFLKCKSHRNICGFYINFLTEALMNPLGIILKGCL